MKSCINSALVVVASATLLACGGGGSSAPAAGSTATEAPTSPVPAGVTTDASAPSTQGNSPASGDAATLSPSQALFEEAALIANGGLYSILDGQLGTPAVLELDSAAQNAIAASPLGKPDGVMGTYLFTQLSSVPLSQFAFDARNDSSGFAVIDNGQIRFVASKTPARYTYVGRDLLVELAAESGDVVARRRVTNITKVALTGVLADAPQEFLNFYGNLLPHVKSGVQFLPGAAYYKQSSIRVGQYLSLQDSDNNLATDVKSVTPVSSGTVEQYAAAQPGALDLSRGSFKMVNGARCWVNSTAGAGNTATTTLTYSDIPSYGAYCEIAQKVYLAVLASDGAQVGSLFASGTLNLSHASFLVRVNKAAFDSIRSMLP